MVEQLTLNQRAQGSSPWKRTKRKTTQFGWSFLLVHSQGESTRARIAGPGCIGDERARWAIQCAGDERCQWQKKRIGGGASHRAMQVKRRSATMRRFGEPAVHWLLKKYAQRHAPSGDNFEVGTSFRKIDLSAQTANRNALSATQSNANEGEQCDNVRGGTAYCSQAVVEAAFRMAFFRLVTPPAPLTIRALLIGGP